jgi:SAM-dependent methyltransferase
MKSISEPQNLEAFIGRMLGDMGAAASGALIIVGDRLGLFRTLAAKGPLTAAGLAAAAGDLDARYVREWLLAMAASGYVLFDADKECFALSSAQQAVFADPESPVALGGGYYSIASLYNDEAKITEIFRTGSGLPWGDHHTCLFCGTEKFFRPGYAAHLVAEWIPALEGVREKLARGARVADIGCGHGCSTTLLARAFPQSHFIGYDIHPSSIENARALAANEGVTNIEFAVATAKDFPGRDYDLISCFDCLHDMGDPVGAAQAIRRALRPDGTWLIVEPMAGDTAAENMNPVGRLYYSFSTMVCTPASRSQEVGLALGAQAGENRLRKVIVEGGGFRTLRRATSTPFNLILEARP